MSLCARSVFVRKAISAARVCARTGWLLPLAALLCSYPVLRGQSPSDDDKTPPKDDRVSITPRSHTPEKPLADIRVDVNLVEIPVSVTDTYGTPVKGLTPKTFRL